MKSLLAIILCFGLTACATPAVHTRTPLQSYDKDTSYAVDDRPDGFALSIYYSKYQFFPESSALIAACKSSLTSIAYEYGDQKGQQIAPINEQRIKISIGRNGLTGITSCSATAVIAWAK